MVFDDLRPTLRSVGLSAGGGVAQAWSIRSVQTTAPGAPLSSPTAVRKRLSSRNLIPAPTGQGLGTLLTRNLIPAPTAQGLGTMAAGPMGTGTAPPCLRRRRRQPGMRALTGQPPGEGYSPT